MDNYDLLYSTPENPAIPVSKPSFRQAVKAMIFGLVALTLAEIPFFGFFTVFPFAIISLCMASNYKKRFPGYGKGFVKAATITSIVSMPMAVVTTVFWVLFAAAESAISYYL